MDWQVNSDTCKERNACKVAGLRLFDHQSKLDTGFFPEKVDEKLVSMGVKPYKRIRNAL